MRRTTLTRFLGDGNDGAVWESNHHTAIKALERQDSYERELAALVRLNELGISTVEDCSVPTLVNFNHRLRVVEMDQTPGFSEEALMDWETDVHELFGIDFERVMQLVSILRSYGIYYFDAKPGNIRF
jgi:hypothetical protein